MTQPSATAWESLTPTSFKNTVYIPSLKISITAGSYITYKTSETEACKNVGRIVEVIASMDSVDGHETHPLLINIAIPEDGEEEVSVHFAKVNIFKDRKSLCDGKFPADDDQFRRWQRIVQLNQYEWIPSRWISGLAFVAMEDDALFLDDCQGMRDFFVAKY